MQAVRCGFAPLMILGLIAGCRPSAEPAAGAPSLDRADVLLLASARTALPPPGLGQADLPEPESRAASLVAAYCSGCHEIPSPATHSATDWVPVLRRMWLRMELLPDSFGIQVPGEGERRVMLDYVKTNALRVIASELPPGEGREEFAVVCSRCHALPDIRNHSARDWPAVFQRMERNMERMNVIPPTGDQASHILLYLQAVAQPR